MYRVHPGRDFYYGQLLPFERGGGGCLQNGAKLCRCNENPPISAGTNTGILQQSGMDQWAMEQGQNTISDRAIWKRHVEI